MNKTVAASEAEPDSLFGSDRNGFLIAHQEFLVADHRLRRIAEISP
jgi:hypothetical protein